MGQHKHNPNCKLAEQGLLPPKPKRLGKREHERRIHQCINEVTGLNKIYAVLDTKGRYYG